MPDSDADASGDAGDAGDVVLHATERRFRTALAGMVDPVAIVSGVTAGRGRKRGEVVDFVVTYVNDRPGTPRVGTLLSSIWPRRDHKRLLATYRRLLEEGRELVFDAFRLPGIDGGDRYLDLRASRLDDNEIIATWRDVTDRIRAETALADSEALLRGAFDDAPVGALLVSLDGAEGADGVDGADGCRLLKVNRAFAALVGYRQHELLGMPLRRLLHPEDLITAASPRDLLERPGEPIRLRRDDGSSVWVRLTSGEVAPRLTGRPSGAPDRPAYSVIHVEDVTSRRQIEQELADRHLHDPLTGLANRHLLLDRFRLAVDNLDRHPGAIVVLHIDLDRFKDVNDTYGHSVGDHVLAEVGRRLDGLVDSPDTAARLAGDEFVIVTAARRRSTAAVTGAATRLAEEVSEVLGEAIALPENDDVTVQLGVSIGIAVTTSPDSEPEQLLLQADRAMFEAKRRGRHRYELFRQGLSHTAPERLKVEQEVRDAVANGWLRLYYQPVIDLTTGRLGERRRCCASSIPSAACSSPAPSSTSSRTAT